MELLEQLCSVHAPCGEEKALRDHILDHVEKNKKNWKAEPTIHQGDDFQDCLILVFGEPRTAAYAHMDSIGFTVKNDQELVPIGGPRTRSGYRLVGKDRKGEVECELKAKPKRDEHGKTRSHDLSYQAKRPIQKGTSLTFKPDFRETDEYVQCCYMDDRLGVWNLLRLCENLENGAVVFSSYEEHGGGSVQFLGRFLYEQYGVRQALISDITWVTSDIHHGKGTAISMRDSGIPRKSYLDRVLRSAEESGIPFQLEVEGAGGSDGIALQHSPYPIDWCFVGAPESNVHTPDEKVHKKDIDSMAQMYKHLMENL